MVRTGAMIPLDGKVVSGEAAVNQSSITGEALPVRKECGSYVYAGTVVERGECLICVDKGSGEGRYDRVVPDDRGFRKRLKSARRQSVPFSGQTCALQSGRHHSHYFLTGNVDESAFDPDGWTSLRAEAVHASGRAFRHA